MDWNQQYSNNPYPYGNPPINPGIPQYNTNPYPDPNMPMQQNTQPPYYNDPNQYQYNQPPPPNTYINDYNTQPPSQFPPSFPPAQNYQEPSHFSSTPQFLDPSVPSSFYQPPPQTFNAPQPMYNDPYYQPIAFQPILNTGRKKALLIGINYMNDPKCRLKGAINDALNLRKLLVERFGFRDEPTSLVLLSDDQRDPFKLPTRTNIIATMKWLVNGAQPGDSLFFHYSGHGSQVADRSGDEEDGLDETICPLDFRTAGQIIDDDIHDILVKSLPAGVRLTAIMDCCHSGTGMDLPYTFTATGSMNTGAHMHGGGDPFRRGRHASSQSKESQADVVLFSGCRDDQTSADATVGCISGGAMTNAFISAISDDPNSTYIQLLYAMRVYMNSGRRSFTQIPQLSSGRLMDMNQRVSL